MPTPRRVLTRSGVAAILLAGGAYTDDGVAYPLRAKTENFLPAGVGGEAVFLALYVTTRHYASAVTLTITPYVDDVALTPHVITLVGVVATEGQQEIHELVLREPFMDGGVERLRNAPRGSRLAVLVEGSSSAAQAIDGIECEFTIVRESQVSA